MAEDDAITGVSKIVDLVDYQDDAVVSRTLVKKTTGTITVFAFDRGQDLSEHTVPYDALVQLLDGEAEIKIAGTPHNLTKGDVLIMPANKPHAVKAFKRFKMVLTMIRS